MGLACLRLRYLEIKGPAAAAAFKSQDIRSALSYAGPGSQIDMGGLIPSWATNYLSSFVAGKAGICKPWVVKMFVRE